MWGYKQNVVLVLFVHRDSSFAEISFTESSFTESRSYSDTVPLVRTSTSTPHHSIRSRSLQVLRVITYT